MQVIASAAGPLMDGKRSMQDTVPMIARCVTLAGSPCSGVLLYRILWWDHLPKVLRGADFWIVNSHEKWGRDTGQTSKQLKLSFLALRQRGLIRTEKHLFRSRIHAFVQLTSTARKGLIETAEMGPIDTSHLGPIKKKGVLKGSSEGSSFLNVVQTHAVKISKSENNTVSGEDKKVAKMKDLTSWNGKKKKTPGEILHKPNSANALAFIWKTRLAELTGKCIGLSVKDVSQLRLFAKFCPAGKAGAILTFVLKDWVYFAKNTQSLAGLTVIPSTPSIGFLLQHRVHAITLWEPPTPVMKEEAPLASCAAKPVQSTATSVAPVSTMTDEEFWSEPDMTDDE